MFHCISAPAPLIRALGLSFLFAIGKADSAVLDGTTYQGVLEQAGAPVNGVYDFRVQLYDAEAGGSLLRQIAVDDVPVVDGLFSIDLDFANDLDLASTTDQRYIQIQVREGEETGSFSTLSPRAEVKAAPAAITAARALTSDQDLNDAYLNGSQISTLSNPVQISGPGGLKVGAGGLSVSGATSVAGDVDIGRTDNIIGSGTLRLFNSLYSNPFAQINDFLGDGGGLYLFDEQDNEIFFVRPDLQGEGASLALFRNTTSTGLNIDGNVNGSGDTRVLISGDDAFARFNMATTGSDSVEIPTASIDPNETSAEAGIALDRATPNVSPPTGSSLLAVAARTVTVPSTGYLMVSGTLELKYAANRHYEYGLSTDGATIANGMEYTFQDLGTGGQITLPLSDVIEVNEGMITISVLIRETNGGSTDFDRVQDVNLALLYVPTSYGFVGRSDDQPWAGLRDEEAVPTAMTLDKMRAEFQAELDRRDREIREIDMKYQRRLSELEAETRRMLQAHPRSQETGR